MLNTAFVRCASVFGVIVPIRCALCGGHGAHVCASCLERLACAPLLRRFARDGVPRVTALGPYAGALRSAVLAVKFRNRQTAAFDLGALLGRRLTDPPDAVVPVPLHRKRSLQRGFNQAEAIAQGIASAMPAHLAYDALVRRRETAAQSSLALRERGQNVRDAFEPGPAAARLRGARVMIVDDVVTSGWTVAGCAAALRSAGVQDIVAVALAVRI
jgi:ComF family protein